jgi:glycosyltransferase involved in cell wall biosynthesis
MNLAILIPTHNRFAELKRLLASIEKSDLYGINYEIVIVSNYSCEKVKSLSQSYSRARYFENSKIGANLARNRALAEARADIGIFLDDDCYIDDPQFFKKHLNYHLDSSVTGVGGVYFPGPESSLCGLSHWKSMMNWLINVPDLKNTFRLIGGNASYKLNKIKNTLFDSKIIYGSAEVSFNFNLYNSGHKLHLYTELYAIHDFDLSEQEMRHKCTQQAINYAQFFTGSSSSFFKKAHREDYTQISNGFILKQVGDLSPLKKVQLQSIDEERSLLFTTVMSQEIEKQLKFKDTQSASSDHRTQNS